MNVSHFPSDTLKGFHWFVSCKTEPSTLTSFGFGPECESNEIYFLPLEAKPNESSPTARRTKPRRKRGAGLRSLTQTAAMKMASSSHWTFLRQINKREEKKQLFIDVFSHSGFSTEDGNETAVPQSREGNSTCYAFPGWRFPLCCSFSLKKSKT